MDPLDELLSDMDTLDDLLLLVGELLMQWSRCSARGWMAFQKYGQQHYSENKDSSFMADWTDMNAAIALKASMLVHCSNFTKDTVQ